MNLNQISLPARDLAASIAFYQALGLTPIVRTAIYARFELPDGEATLSLHQTDAKLGDEGVYVYFECDDLDRRVRDLQVKGIAFASEPEDKRWLWREAWLTDPAGNRLCLFTAGANRKNPPWRLGASNSARRREDIGSCRNDFEPS
ncbi:MAG: VOC family protein [Parvibaculaceae bacterium]